MPIEVKVIMSFALITILISVGGVLTIDNEKMKNLFKFLFVLDLVVGVLYVLYVLRS